MVALKAGTHCVMCAESAYLMMSAYRSLLASHFKIAYFCNVQVMMSAARTLECRRLRLKIIDTIVKTHDKDFIFSCDAFEMCSIDLTNFHSMLTGLRDRY